MLTKAEFDRLLNHEGKPAVSLYMPRHIGSRDVRQDPARLRNLITAAEGKLAEIGIWPEDADRLLAPVRALAADEAFWRQQAHGLAVFVSNDGVNALNLTYEPQEHVSAGERFHLFPLLRTLSGDNAFLILTISGKQARLYAASRDRMLPTPVILPAGIESIASRTEYEATRGARPAAHSTGAMKTDTTGNPPKDNRKVELIEYLREVSRAVEDYARREQLPVVLAALPEVQGHYRALGHHPELLYLGLSENPDAMDEQLLHRKALETIGPVFADAEKQVIDRFNAMSGGKRISTEIDNIAEAAREGRVDTLILAAECEAQLDDDLLDTALTCALRTGAQAHIVPQFMMPERAPAAAIFRY